MPGIKEEIWYKKRRSFNWINNNGKIDWDREKIDIPPFNGDSEIKLEKKINKARIIKSE